MANLIPLEEASHGVYNGELVRDYNIDCMIPDAQEFLEAMLFGTTEVKTDYNNILMCALPKSGSQHTWQLISRSLGYDKSEVSFNIAAGTFYYPRMLAAKYSEKNTISHCHEPMKVRLARVIGELDLKPLIHTRNLLDTLVSRRDRLLKYYPPDLLPPELIEKFHSSDNEYQLDTVIEMFANEYISFVTGWGMYGDTDVMRTTYEEMLEDEVGLVERVADWLGCEVIDDVERISREIKEAGGINFNKGVSGRGRELFNDRQKVEILRKAVILGCTNEEFLGGLLWQE